MSASRKPIARRIHILWTHAEVKHLTDAVNAKTPIKVIAADMMKSEKAIRRKCEWLGISSSTTYRPKDQAPPKRKVASTPR